MFLKYLFCQIRQYVKKVETKNNNKKTAAIYTTIHSTGSITAGIYFISCIYTFDCEGFLMGLVGAGVNSPLTLGDSVL